MPQLGETVTEGTITKWFKQVGDTVAEDEVLFEVSTDKVDSEVPSPAGGVVSEILVAEGETVEVGAVLAPARRSGRRARDRTTAPAGVGARNQRPSRTIQRRRPSRPRHREATPAAESAPEPAIGRVRTGPVAGRAAVDRRARPRREHDHRHRPRGAHHPSRCREGHRRARRCAPLAPPATVSDVDRAGGRRARPRRRPRPTGPDGGHLVEFNRIRQRTGEHMVMSKATSPHVLTAIEVDYEGVERVRRAPRRAVQGRGGVQPHLPPVHRPGPQRPCSGEFPHLNATVADQGLQVHDKINLGDRGRLELRGVCSRRSCTTSTASGCGRSPARSARPSPVGRGRSSSAPTTS